MIQKKVRREDLGPDENLCDHCTAKCCKYFALPIDTPTEFADFEFIRWYLLHDRASVFLDEDVWYLLVHTTCKHLQDDHRCGIYETRPQICRDYTTDACEYDDDWCYEKYFETPEQIWEYAEATTPRRPGQSLRSPKPPQLPILNQVRGTDPDLKRRSEQSGANNLGSPLSFWNLSSVIHRTPNPMSNKKKLIQPRTLKGFRDYLPDAMMPREELVNTARRVYRSYGFAPIDTPTLEYAEILLGKGSDETDRQMYRFEDHGKRDVGMRFDLTVPLARFAAQHIGELGTPFKRYHIATVWRGENTQRGRYREFMQCDFDTIGTKSIVADIETALVIHDLMLAIGFEGFTVRVNNRQVLSGLLEKLELVEKSTEILRALDKLAKIGAEKVAAEMQETAGASAEQAAQVLKLAEIGGSTDEILSALDRLVAGSEKGEIGVGQLRELTSATAAAGVPAERLQIDVSIARGLDYYTGTIFETFLSELPGIGSVCSGGRYNDLASLYTNQELPGIGASLGLDRLLAAMEELGKIEARTTPAEVFLPYFDESSLQQYLKIAATLRTAGFNVELYPEAKKLGQQLKYADRRGFKVAVVAGDRELAENKCQVKDLKTGDSTEASLAGGAEELIAGISQILRPTA